MNEFVWLIRREVWEHRALYIVPFVFLVLTVVSTVIGFAQGREYVDLSWGVRKLEEVGIVGHVAGHVGLTLWLLFSLVSAIVAAFYLLDALWGDRKDRSILFWKSLPISDTHTVLSKLTTGVVVAPMIAVAASLVATIAILIMGSIAIHMGEGNPITLLWAEFPFFTLVYKAVGVSILAALWFLPFSGWFLFSSAAARKTPFLFALLLPVGVAVVEELALDTNYFLEAVGSYIQRFFLTVFEDASTRVITIDDESIELPAQLSEVGNLAAPLTEPLFPVGLIIGAALIAATIYMRRHRVDAG